ncbi:hypothetical protein [Streptomyces sp. TRM75561]|uniref:hypothetical protein n=1 Tax=Streptomyces sp. TRM75561 TaxID=2975269 RepID=UPI002447B125|nr:hypothetical protein [Streptomyces sp. TRM75561]MDH3038402.1 hypothetical protein [Streptomyces sp. TRM75561]
MAFHIVVITKGGVPAALEVFDGNLCLVSPGLDADTECDVVVGLVPGTISNKALFIAPLLDGGRRRGAETGTRRPSPVHAPSTRVTHVPQPGHWSGGGAVCAGLVQSQVRALPFGGVLDDLDGEGVHGLCLWAAHSGGGEDIITGSVTHSPARPFGRHGVNSACLVLAALVVLAVGSELAIAHPTEYGSLTVALLLFGGPVLT